MRILTSLTLMLCSFALANSAFQLVREVPGGWDAYCSGAVVERIGVTAGHCVQDLNPGATVYVRDIEGYVYAARLVESCYEWPRCDHALLSGAFVWILDSLELADTLPQPGGYAAYVGAPLGLGLFPFTGAYVGRIWNDPGLAPIAGMLLFDIRAGGGSSGSILTNARGEAVAILVGGFGYGVQCDFRGCRIVGKPIHAALAVDLRNVLVERD